MVEFIDKGRVRKFTLEVSISKSTKVGDVNVKLVEERIFDQPVNEDYAFAIRESLLPMIRDQLLRVVEVGLDDGESNSDNSSYQIDNFSKSKAFTSLNPALKSLNWKSVPHASNKPDEKVIYLSFESLSHQEMVSRAHKFLEESGFPPDGFEFNDERYKADEGKPLYTIFNIKINEDFEDLLPRELVFSDKGYRKILANGNFDKSGNLNFRWANKAIAEEVREGKYDQLKGVKGSKVEIEFNADEPF